MPQLRGGTLAPGRSKFLRENESRADPSSAPKKHKLTKVKLQDSITDVFWRDREKKSLAVIFD